MLLPSSSVLPTKHNQNLAKPNSILKALAPIIKIKKHAKIHLQLNHHKFSFLTKNNKNYKKTLKSINQIQNYSTIHKHNFI